MLRIVLMATLACGSWYVAADAAESLPYTGIVNRAGAVLRSGPGTHHYMTSKVNKGTRLEVYQVTDDGWLAIRPPEGCYSLVNSTDVRLTDRIRVAEAEREGVEVRIGSQFERFAKLRKVIRLSKGERVQVLEQQRFDGSDDVWFKIAPPAGEFRWIDANAVDLATKETATSPVRRVSAQEVVKEAGKVVGATGFRDVTSQEVRYDATATIDGQQRLAFRNPATAPAPLDSAPVESLTRVAVRKPKRSPSATPSATRETVRIPSSASNAAATSRSAESGVSARFAEELDELGVELSIIVARSSDRWDFEEIRKRTEALIAQGKTPLERGRARLLQARIDEFAELRDRQALAKARGNSRVVPTSAQLAAPAPSVAVGTGVSRSAQDRTVDEVDQDVELYDAAGWLLPVYSTRATTPPYAITDNNRNVLFYVSPAPGLNLHRYLRKEIGIYGQRAHVQHLKKPHVTARRVIDLKRHPQFYTATRQN